MSDLAVVRFHDDDHVLTATITGEIDLSNRDTIRESIDAQLADTTTLVIDLSATSFIDSSGVALILEIANRLHTTRRAFYLIIPGDAHIRRIATLSGLDTQVTLLAHANDVKEAK